MKWWPHFYTEREGDEPAIWRYRAIDLDELGSLKICSDYENHAYVVMLADSWRTETQVAEKVHSFFDFKPGQITAIPWQRWDAVNGWTHWQGARCKPRKAA